MPSVLQSFQIESSFFPLILQMFCCCQFDNFCKYIINISHIPFHSLNIFLYIFFLFWMRISWKNSFTITLAITYPGCFLFKFINLLGRFWWIMHLFLRFARKSMYTNCKLFSVSEFNIKKNLFEFIYIGKGSMWIVQWR